MTRETYETLVLIGVCAVLAFILLRKFSPYLWGRRKDETHIEHVTRALDEQRQEKQRQNLLNTTPARARTIHLVNCGLLLGTLYVSARFNAMQFYDFAIVYVMIGFIVNALLRVIPRDQFDGLNLGNRVYLRLFHAWQWPRYIAASILGRRSND